MALQWLYSGSTVALQWVYNEQKTNKRRTKNEQRTNKRRRKSVAKLVLSRRILERVRQVSSFFYAFKLTF
ncbi:dihydrolipoyllysine-residue succinyltransferase [Capnocytophaga sp. oral taxon 864]|nr:dihydrolipoyllysine-residue succinyltransferase [Capnocytophaga sp. oral taxon 864]